MNKLVFIYLLSLIILNIQCAGDDCSTLTPPGATPSGDTQAHQGGRRLEVQKCEGAKEVTGYDCVVVNNACTLKSLCELESDTSKCENHKELTDKKCTKVGSACQLTSTATNSSSILNIFKITFILLFIFTVL
jgi:hypothetical protein